MSVRFAIGAVIASLGLALMGGCASAPAQKVQQFWPPAPDAPRVQYLTRISDSNDVLTRKSFSLLDTGGQQEQTIPIVKPYGLAVKKGVLYVVDTVQAQVVMLDLPRKKASVLSGNVGQGKLQKPIAVAVDADGVVFVADTVRKKVLKYGADGSFKGAVSEEEMKPVGVDVDDMNVYILDQQNGLVRVYDRRTSAPVRTFGQESENPKGRLATPLALGLDGKGGVYVSNLDGRLVQFDRDGHAMRAFGKLGTGLAEYNRPRSISFDKGGIMYVVDAASQNVRLLGDDFQLLMSFGEPGTIGSLNIPAGLAVSEDDLEYYQKLADPDFILDRVIFVVSQFGESKVSVYGLGKKKGVDYDALLKERLEQIRKKEEALVEAEKKEKAKEQAKDAKAVPAATTPAPDQKK